MQILDQLCHVACQLCAVPGWQTQHARGVGLLKIVYVTPVGRYLLGAGLVCSIALDQGMLAGAGRTQRKQVVALVLNPHAEPDCIDRPWLADDFL